MYLRSITMKGFKSFPERVSLEFSPGVSVIVGPNGSGKSNITDAVLWALGEQSPGAIRGASMQDVISAGGKNTSQRREAQVEVVIDNSDGRAATEFSEISVERRLDRSGDGGYRLNGARARLADVIEVLSDTNLGREMHSVISQGRVETIIHSKPRERRLLIEEAAGLGKHRKRRRRAELKLKGTRDNLDRALDVEREARARLRPLKRQAQAAEIGARIEREEMELKARIVSEELRFGADRAAAAAKAAATARATRSKLEEQLAAVSKRRSAAEERFAERDRARTQAWGLLTKLRSESERVAVRAAGLSRSETEVEERLERLRVELGPLTFDVGESGAPAQRTLKLEEELGEVDAGLKTALDGLATARSADAAESARENALGDVRAGSERAIRHARRAESLLGERHREKMRARLAGGEELLDDVRAALAAVEAAAGAIRARVERTESTVVGNEGDGDEIADELRACSKLEFEVQAQMRTVGEELTKAEVEAAHLGDRRAEAEREMKAIVEKLGEAVPPAEEAMTDEERADIDRRLERLDRRRAQIGPVNPLAERESRPSSEPLEERVVALQRGAIAIDRQRRAGSSTRVNFQRWRRFANGNQLLPRLTEIRFLEQGKLGELREIRERRRGNPSPVIQRNAARRVEHLVELFELQCLEFYRRPPLLFLGHSQRRLVDSTVPPGPQRQTVGCERGVLHPDWACVVQSRRKAHALPRRRPGCEGRGSLISVFWLTGFTVKRDVLRGG